MTARTAKTAPRTELLIPQEMVDPTTLTEHPRNYREHDDSIRDSIAELDLVQPVTINRGTLTGRPNEILGGHGTVKAWIAEHPGEPIQASVVDVDERKGRKILLALNRTNQLGRDREEALYAILTELDGDYRGTGYLEDDYDALHSDLTITDEAPTDAPADKFAFDTPHLSGTRIMVLEFELPVFKWIQDHLSAIRDEIGVDSNVDVVVRLVADKVGDTPPPTPLRSETDE